MLGRLFSLAILVLASAACTNAVTGLDGPGGSTTTRKGTDATEPKSPGYGAACTCKGDGYGPPPMDCCLSGLYCSGGESCGASGCERVGRCLVSKKMGELCFESGECAAGLRCEPLPMGAVGTPEDDGLGIGARCRL